MEADALYARYLAGDEAAGDALMLSLGGALTAYLAAFLHDPRDAEDMMLDCFAALLVNRPRIGEGNLRAWLFKTGRNRACRLWRLRLRRREFSLDEALTAAGESAEAAVLKGESRAALARCLNRIAPQYREALYLCCDLEMSYAQAASVLGCRTKKVEDLLRNGRKRLRLELEKEGITRADL